MIKGDGGGENDDLFDLYHDDFNRDMLEAQLFCFHNSYDIKEDMGITDIIQLLKGMSVAEKSLFSQVIKVARTLLVVPATNSISERSFSAMRRIKTYLRSTMLQERLNSVMVMHVHQDFTDTLNLNCIANEFCSKSDHRKDKFPKF